MACANYKMMAQGLVENCNTKNSEASFFNN